MRTTVSAFCVILLGLGSGVASAEEIRGDYIEARTADIFTGPCFSNAEVFITGNKAVMAWKVTEGSWNGVDLTGLHKDGHEITRLTGLGTPLEIRLDPGGN